VKRDVFQYFGTQPGTAKANRAWEIVIEQEHQGFSYKCDGAFTGKRYANNEDQALQWAREDIESGGTQHAWRTAGEGAPEIPVETKIVTGETVCASPQKSSTLGSLCGRALRWLSKKPAEK
jgi:hypothetical protein